MYVNATIDKPWRRVPVGVAIPSPDYWVLALLVEDLGSIAECGPQIECKHWQGAGFKCLGRIGDLSGGP